MASSKWKKLNRCPRDAYGLSGRVVQVAVHQRAGQRAAVTNVTVPVAAAVVTVAGRQGAVTGQPVPRQPVAGHPVRRAAVRALSGQRAVPRDCAVAGEGAVAGYWAVPVAVSRVVAVRVRVCVVAAVSATLLLFGDLLYGQETVLPHLYPFGHVPDRRVLCNTDTNVDVILFLGDGGRKQTTNNNPPFRSNRGTY